MSNKSNLNPKIKKLFEENIEEVNNNNWMYLLIVKASNANFMDSDYLELFTILKDVIGISEKDILTYKWKLFDYIFAVTIKYHYNETLKDPFERKIHSWSRFDYIMEEVPSLEFTRDELIQHIKNNYKNLGLPKQIEPLESGYGWYGDDDYDLGYFNKEGFDKFYK